SIDVARLKKAGCVILGKTNTPEFGYAGVTHNKVFGETKNPWNLERTSGGSSGGAGAAVASGIGPLALGSDGGGSIRHPSRFRGIFGLKPTFGRIPVYPSVGISGYSISHHGPMTRYVKDAALMMDVMKGFHELDRDSLPDEGISYMEHISEKPKELRILFSLDLGHAKVLDPDVEKSVRDAVQKVEQFGWTLDIPKKLRVKPPVIAFNTLYTSMYAYDLGSKLKKQRDLLDPDLIKLIEAGLTYPATALMNAFLKRRTFYEKMYKALKDYDVLITPTTAIPAFELGKMFPSKINGVGVSPTGWQPFTWPFNLTGQPGATVPCGWSKDGLPFGLQIVGHRFADLLVLQVAQAFEELSPWQDKKPKF
ncbi:MAG: amidase, partial [Promethearchaeota archaeon]